MRFDTTTKRNPDGSLWHFLIDCFWRHGAATLHYWHSRRQWMWYVGGGDVHLGPLEITWRRYGR